MKFTTATTVLVLLALGLFAAPASAGPYHVTIPVVGLEESHLPALQKAFEQRFARNVLQLKIVDGSLEFLAGGSGPKALLRLSEVIEVLAEVGLKIDTGTWILKKQDVGVHVSAKDGISEKELHRAIVSFKGAKVEVLGTLLDSSRMCVVIHLKGEVDHAAFRRHLKESGVAIDDLVWGHWKYGWGIETKDGRHRHNTGARLKSASHISKSGYMSLSTAIGIFIVGTIIIIRRRA